MNKTFVRIFIWLGLMAILTLVAMGIWMVVWGGNQSTISLKWFQLLQTMATFLLPSILGAWIWTENHNPFQWLQLNRRISWQVALCAVLIMVCAIPGINLLADLNSRVELPESLDFIEQIMKQQEDAAMHLTEMFLQADSLDDLLVNMALMALMPALAEELAFRGTLQQLISRSENGQLDRHIHWAIWIAACIFSAIHMQFYGFVPRMLMGAMFGYVFVWTGSLWTPVIMHFTNNGIAVLSYYFLGNATIEKKYADTFGAGTTWWVGIISLVVVATLLFFLYRFLKQSR